MKCEKCNDREANFFWTATINGKTEQHCLCEDCARAEGFYGAFEKEMAGVLASPFGMMDSLFHDDFFGDLFGNSFFPSFGRSMFAPAMTMPRLLFDRPETGTARPEAGNRPGAETAQSGTDGKDIPRDAGAEFKARRELAALKHQLKAAVRSEDFEKAIELRDKIKELEG